MSESLEICAQNYKRWKEKVLKGKDLEQVKKAARKAFFWAELHSAFLFLNQLETSNSLHPSLLKAKARIVKKLSEYAEEISKEISNFKT